MADNFYSSMLDWNYNGYLAIGHGKNRISILNPSSDHSSKGLSLDTLSFSRNMDITSLSFSPLANQIVYGSMEGTIEIYDYIRNKMVTGYPKAQSDRISII